MRNLNFWSKFFILSFWSSQCLRLLRPFRNPKGQKKNKSMLFHWYSWNSEVETTSKSLIRWRHKTSSPEVPNCDYFLVLFDTFSTSYNQSFKHLLLHLQLSPDEVPKINSWPRDQFLGPRNMKTKYQMFWLKTFKFLGPLERSSGSKTCCNTTSQ